MGICIRGCALDHFPAGSEHVIDQRKCFRVDSLRFDRIVRTRFTENKIVFFVKGTDCMLSFRICINHDRSIHDICTDGESL